ncbi:MAG: PLP-dependent aspartate aminotransferase family protein [Alphaproteobacteria bacterium]
MTKNDWSARSKAAQALGWIEPETGALSPPMYPSSTFQRDADNDYRKGFSYARDTNPTYRQAEALICELEGAETALLFGSGMAAAVTVFQALKPGDHVIAPEVMYWGLRQWLATEATRWGLDVCFVPNDDLDAWRAAIRPTTKLLWVETPSNPMWQVTDIAAVAELAHGHGARLAVDGTVATPVLSQPLELGADIIMHSGTKYLGGHSDLIAGVLATKDPSDPHWQRIAAIRHDGGAILGTLEAWLLLRGMRTLFLRVEAACRNADAIAEHFSGHPLVAQVLYPGLPSHPGHEIAARQMTGGFGGMLSIRVNGGEAAAIAAAAKVKLWKRATSLGGTESLIEHRASIEGVGTPVPADLLRLSCGIEAADDLIADLEAALTAAHT